MSERSTQADLLRVWIDEKLDVDTKFYSLQSKSKQDRIDFVNAHPELSTNEKTVKPSFHKILDERLRLRKIRPKDAKVTRKKLPKFQHSDMDATVNPEPQNPVIGQPTSNQPMQMPVQPAIPGQPVPGMPNQPYVNPNMTVESIGALCQGGMAGIKSILPDLELLNEEEKKSIGAILLPPLSRIEDERIQLYLFPILGVLGIVGPKIAKARNIKKQKNLKNKKEKIPEKKDDETLEEFQSRMKGK